MLEMLPSQNQYFSVLCGAITTLVKVSLQLHWHNVANMCKGTSLATNISKASANHQRIAEGLGKALMDTTSKRQRLLI